MKKINDPVGFAVKFIVLFIYVAFIGWGVLVFFGVVPFYEPFF